MIISIITQLNDNDSFWTNLTRVLIAKTIGNFHTRSNATQKTPPNISISMLYMCVFVCWFNLLVIIRIFQNSKANQRIFVKNKRTGRRFPFYMYIIFSHSRKIEFSPFILDASYSIVYCCFFFSTSSSHPYQGKHNLSMFMFRCVATMKGRRKFRRKNRRINYYIAH